jgi:hypothetical protein
MIQNSQDGTPISYDERAPLSIIILDIYSL